MECKFDNGRWLVYTEDASESSTLMKSFPGRVATYSRQGVKFAWSWSLTRQEYRSFFRDSKPQKNGIESAPFKRKYAGNYSIDAPGRAITVKGIEDDSGKVGLMETARGKP
jgi:hypothetical protein